jgi:Predicted esterase of the alpha-beta hydrolase superfamily
MISEQARQAAPSQVRSFLKSLRPKPAKRRLSLALQGGGSFGAFTWGVLDGLLERDAVTLDCISGASAGAVNAVVLADGLARGGAAEARSRLEHFWKRVSDAAPPSLFGKATDGVGYAALDVLLHVLSPYDFNPFSRNPLRDILAEEVDFERLRRASPVRLLIAATRVTDGSVRLFREHELTVDAVLASACLPLLQPAVEIDGEPYWDGGYSANPPLTALARESRASDVLLVRITPRQEAKSPQRAPAIARRISQIVFNTALEKEIEALRDLCRLCDDKSIGKSSLCRKLRQLRLHVICAEKAIEGLSHENALSLDWTFLTRLKEGGRAAVEDWWARDGLSRNDKSDRRLLAAPPTEAGSLPLPA